MSTSPRNQDALLSTAPKPAARQPRPGERLWTLRKDGRVLHAELRDDRDAGAELQIFRDGEWTYGRRYLSRGIALEEAAGCRAQFEADGWTS